ncbi:MAG: glycosyltransferase [Chloroflexota bacterium]
MRIAYLSRLPLSQERGVLKKVVGQIRAWMPLVDEAKLFALSSTDEVWDGMADIPLEWVLSGTGLTVLWRAHVLIRRLLAWNPDVVYLRWGPHWPSLGLLMRRVPTFLEVNTDDLAEYRRALPRFKYVYHRLTRGMILRGARGLVCVTNELADRYRHHNHRTLTVGNGIELSRYRCRDAPCHPDPRLVLMAGVGERTWHGIDKVAWLARRFPRWQFDLIGVTGEHLQRMGADAPANVKLHGTLGRAQYEAILADADIGLGTLALHRKSMDEACPIKVREYLAFGIPAIIGYHDTDFPQGASFLLELRNTPTNVAEHVSQIEQFVNAWKGKVVPRQEIAHLDWGFKAEKMLAWFQEVIGATGRRGGAPQAQRRESTRPGV